ncbi:DUF3021 domain-containing protein [Oceanobacillus neutriphilus]|uniref:DUF3021 domain-containing protein n=1 Tax=Oceanobacillus neutriphilus TaxID=531815 RepID=A0ABQ2NVN3_9BACI|nr:DUF3021 domain-containing protein [Oceanobacillus neutriphilus]GGP11683.1 hypothetical protein GCM10011346_24660 [Oceanobacillus neutriphilus]
MILEALKRAVAGIAIGGILTFIALTIMKFNEYEATVSEIWMHMGASMLLGIYFGVSSLIFGDSGDNLVKKSIIHFLLSYSVWLIIAGTAGWVPLNVPVLLGSSLSFSLLYLLNWFGWFLYFKKVETTLNNHLQKNK